MNANLARVRGLLVPAVAGLVLFSTSLLADPDNSNDIAPTPTMPQAGLTVAIDPDGAIRMPTAAERAALAKRIGDEFNQSSEGLEIVEHANGMRSVDLKGRFQSMSVARYDDNGKLVHDCFDNEKAATEFLMPNASTKLEVQ